MNSSILQDTGLWEVWIEYDEFDPENFGTLYVIGEVRLQYGVHAGIQKLGTPDRSHELVLHVPSSTHTRSRTKEVLYSETIRSIDQYGSVAIFAGDELIASFDEIEVLI